MTDLGFKWEGSLQFEKVLKYLPHFRSAIQVPIFIKLLRKRIKFMTGLNFIICDF